MNRKTAPEDHSGVSDPLDIDIDSLDSALMDLLTTGFGELVESPLPEARWDAVTKGVPLKPPEK
jgi:hypothetical protein